MNNNELEHLLRSVPAPERDDAYWKEFPEALSRRIGSEAQPPAPHEPCRTSPLLKRNWGLAFAGVTAVVACFVFFLLPPKHPGSPTQEQLQSLRVCYQQIRELFPQQMEAVILSPDGVQLQLSDTPDVPDSPPLFVRICAPSAPCATAVSFSGRKIRVAGREFEILANGAGEIFVIASEWVWVSGQGPVSGEGWRFESGWLEHSL